jgi:cell division protein FtsB
MKLEFVDFRSKRHVLRRQIRDLHRSAAEISSFSLLGAVSRREIVYRLRGDRHKPDD